MEEIILKYRQSHPKCKWCKFCKYNYAPCNLTANWYSCRVKDKIVNIDIPRFCKYYQVKEDNSEKS